ASDDFVTVGVHLRCIDGKHGVDDGWLDGWYATLLIVVFSRSEVIDERWPSLIAPIRQTGDRQGKIGISLGRCGVEHEFSACKRGIDAWRHRNTLHDQLD